MIPGCQFNPGNGVSHFVVSFSTNCFYLRTSSETAALSVPSCSSNLFFFNTWQSRAPRRCLPATGKSGRLMRYSCACGPASMAVACLEGREGISDPRLSTCARVLPATGLDWCERTGAVNIQIVDPLSDSRWGMNWQSTLPHRHSMTRLAGSLGAHVMI